jgi:hypothetical protein
MDQIRGPIQGALVGADRSLLLGHRRRAVIPRRGLIFLKVQPCADQAFAEGCVPAPSDRAACDGGFELAEAEGQLVEPREEWCGGVGAACPEAMLEVDQPGFKSAPQLRREDEWRMATSFRLDELVAQLPGLR